MRRILFTISFASLFAVACQQAGEGGNASQPSAQANASGGGEYAQMIRDRQGHFKQMGPAMKAIGDQLKSDNPDMAAIQQRTALLASFGPQVGTWFGAGSGTESGVKTRAQAAIWSDPEGFRAAALQYEQASAAAHRAAQAGDLAALRTAVPALGKSCSNCHERFRAPEND